MHLRQRTLIIAIAALCSMAFVFVQHAQALQIFAPLPETDPYSIQLRDQCIDEADPNSNEACIRWFLWDPPTGVTQIGFEFHYDSTKLTFLPSHSGFLCDFSDGTGDCPAVAPATVQQGFVNVGGPRPGTTYDLVAGNDTITLFYDLRSNPVSAGSPSGSAQNFFALAFNGPKIGVVFNNTATGDFFQVPGPNHVCLFDSMEPCGSEHPIPGGSFVPEPSTYLPVAFVCILWVGRSRTLRDACGSKCPGSRVTRPS